MTKLEKLNEILTNDPEQQKKLHAEIQRIADAKETDDPKKGFASAVKTVLNIDFSEGELNEFFPKQQELTEEQVAQVSGGGAPEALIGAMVGSLIGEAFGDIAGPAGAAIGCAVGAIGGGIIGWKMD